MRLIGIPAKPPGSTDDAQCHKSAMRPVTTSGCGGYAATHVPAAMSKIGIPSLLMSGPKPKWSARRIMKKR